MIVCGNFYFWSIVNDKCLQQYLKSSFFPFGQDDMQIRVFNYNTLERVHMFEAHSDYIRCIAVHPTQPYILTSSGMLLNKEHTRL